MTKCFGIYQESMDKTSKEIWAGIDKRSKELNDANDLASKKWVYAIFFATLLMMIGFPPEMCLFNILLFYFIIYDLWQARREK